MIGRNLKRVSLALIGAVLGICAMAAQPLVDLDASALPEGPLAAWRNVGTLGGIFTSPGTNARVKVIDGVKAVDFGGKDYMLSDFKAPTAITGDKPWTCVVKTLARNVSAERCVFSWANRAGNSMELEYGDATLWGAIGTWSAYTSGWLEKVPAPNKWHTLIYTYDGGKDGDFQAWSDGELIVNRKFSLDTKPERAFVLGACADGGDNPGDAVNYVHQIDGAVASLKLYDRGFTPVECWNASGMQSAFPLSPERDSTIDVLSATLKWVPGSPDVASYDIYFGTSPLSLDIANNQMDVGVLGEYKNVYKGNLPATQTYWDPEGLGLGYTYYWRVDERSSSGAVTKGSVASFSTITGNASDPDPADGYIFVEGGKHTLHWTPGKFAEKQNIYIGSSLDEVKVGPKMKAVLSGIDGSVTSIDLPIKNPALGKTYYWRVESVNTGRLGKTWGKVWTFRVVSRKLKVYISSGQSNAVGCSMVTGMPEKYKGFNRDVIIFVRGECRVGDGKYGWDYLRDGLGSGFGDRDGKGTFGPELLFGYNMARQDPSQVIGIIKIAWGGTNLGVQWRPPSAGGETGPLYKGWVDAYKEALAKLDPQFKPDIAGMLWMQGESDTGDETMARDYGKNLTALVKDFRAETKSPNMPFVLATISKAPAWDKYGDIVRAAEAEVAKTVPNTATFLTDDYGMGDPWHYDTPGMVSLGERFAVAMKKLGKK